MNELNYSISVRFLRGLLRDGLLSDAEYEAAHTVLLKRYKPLLASGKCVYFAVDIS